MNTKVYLFAPYVLIIIANVIYLYANGLSDIGTVPQLFMYNLLLIAILGVFMIINFNIWVSKWLKDSSKQDQRNKIRQKIKQIVHFSEFILSSFTQGNQRFLIKFYAILSLWSVIESIIPRFLFGILVATYFQYKQVIVSRFGGQFNKLAEDFNQLVGAILEQLPRYIPNQIIEKNEEQREIIKHSKKEAQIQLI